MIDNLESIQSILNKEILPGLEMQGGKVEVLALDEGVLKVRLIETCAGCPATVCSIIGQIEAELLSRAPHVAYLEAVP